jgi:hypothetical protein
VLILKLGLAIENRMMLLVGVADMDRWNDFNAKSEFYTGFIEKSKDQKVGHIIPFPTLQRTKLFLFFWMKQMRHLHPNVNTTNPGSKVIQILSSFG